MARSRSRRKGGKGGKRGKRRGRGKSVFLKAERSGRLSQIRKRERERVSKRLSVLLSPDGERKSRQIKRRKRGPKRFKRTLNAFDSVNRNTLKADVFRRAAVRVGGSVLGTYLALQKVGDFFGLTGKASRLARAEAKFASRL